MLGLLGQLIQKAFCKRILRMRRVQCGAGKKGRNRKRQDSLFPTLGGFFYHRGSSFQSSTISVPD